MVESNVAPHGENKEQVSFSVYIKEKYNLHYLFLPGHKPANDELSFEELVELDELIACRDHFEIRQRIASRYPGQN